MAVRLRPQSSAWMAPHALAAQLNAQTGQIAASGPQSLLAGIAQGVGAFTQGRDKRRAEAINESRYQDSLKERASDNARQDKSFQYGVIRDQAELNKEFKTGADLAYALDPTPENKMKVDQADSNAKALAAAAAKYGGVQMPQMSQAPRGVPAPAPQGAVAPTAGTEPTAAGAYSGEDMRRLATSMKDMSDEELNYVSEQYAQEALTRGETLKAAGRPGAGPSRTRTEYGEYSILARLAKGEQERRAAKAKPAELEAEGAARARGAASVSAPLEAAEREEKAKAEAAELAAINESRKAEGLKPLASLRQVSPQMTTERQSGNREDSQAHAKEMAQIKNANSLGRMAQAEETKKRLIDYAGSVGKANDPRFKMLSTMRDDAVNSARSLYAAADNDTINKAAVAALMERADAEMARVKEFDKQMAMVFGEASTRPAPAPSTPSAPVPTPAATPAPAGAPAGESSADRLKRLWGR